MEDMYSEANPLTDREKKCLNLWLTVKTQKKSLRTQHQKRDGAKLYLNDSGKA